MNNKLFIKGFILRWTACRFLEMEADEIIPTLTRQRISKVFHSRSSFTDSLPLPPPLPSPAAANGGLKDLSTATFSHVPFLPCIYSETDQSWFVLHCFESLFMHILIAMNSDTNGRMMTSDLGRRMA